MRIWVIISSVFILVFCVPGLLLAAFEPDGQAIAICMVLNALAIHGLYYAKAALTAPHQGYRHLAANQFVLGIVCALLLLRLNSVLGDPALWDLASQRLVGFFQNWPGMAASPQEIQAALQEVFEPTRRRMAVILWISAALAALSQTLFAWMLYRRAST